MLRFKTLNIDDQQLLLIIFKENGNFFMGISWILIYNTNESFKIRYQNF